MPGTSFSGANPVLQTEVEVPLWTLERAQIFQRLRLIVVTGTSPTDKAAFMRLLHVEFPRLRPMSTVTTRERIALDLPDEYLYLTDITSRTNPEHIVQTKKRQFIELDQKLGFAWSHLKRGKRFGVLRQAFCGAFHGAYPLICQTEVKCVPEIFRAMERYGLDASALCVLFIKTPRNLLEQELKQNPDFTKLDVKKRLHACGEEEYAAMHTGYPYQYINYGVHSETKTRFDIMSRFAEIIGNMAG